MRIATDCTHRAEECRRLAKLVAAKPEAWRRFPEMAETWEMLAKQRPPSDKLTETYALAQAIANNR